MSRPRQRRMSVEFDPVDEVILTLPAATIDTLSQRLTRQQQDQLITDLRRTYTAEGVALWLRGRNRNLNRTSPLTLLAWGSAHDIEAVLAEAARVGNA